jgi:molybdopterin/thiamine biosynthesis adenylyltransferase
MGAKRIDLVDPDTIEQTNLNRQVLFYDKVGEYKANTLRTRLKELNYSLESRVTHTRFDFSCMTGVYDAIFSCVDTISGRKSLSEAGNTYKIPLISGGTTATEGSIYTYVPAKTPTITEQCSLDLLKEEDARSCIQAQPSVIIPNMIIGSLMVEAYLRARAGNVKTGYYSAKGVSWK